MAYPSTVKMSQATLTSITPTLKTKSISGIETRASVGSQYFQVNGSFNNITDDESRALYAFLISGSITAFDLPLPNPIGNTSGTDYGTFNVTSGVAAGNTSLTVDTPSYASGTLAKAGDLISFSSTHDKVYMLTADFTVSAYSGTMNIFPALTSAITTADDVVYRSVEMKVRIANDEMAESITTGQFSSFSLLFEEVIE
tara:strand:- start:1103 stop:1699 length:597 start_codon:yes stop_codon:yes gene_type:complete